MTAPRFHTTPTAEAHFLDALDESLEKWGEMRTEQYRLDFLAGLEKLAKNHRSIGTGHRTAMTQGTDFKLHLMEHRYVVFQTHDAFNIIIAGIFHERMDIPTRLLELALLTKDEIAAIVQQIDGP
jgi:plasmid stabilization system protein ParE